MNSTWKPSLIHVLCSLAICSQAKALTRAEVGKPYQAIGVRNAFNLHAPQPQPGPISIKASPPKITLLGTTDILNKKLAIFRLAFPAGPNNAAKELVLNMIEGERQGEIELLKIDPKAGAITVNNHGTLEVKTIEKDGAQPPTIPLIAPSPGLQQPRRLPTTQPMTPEEQIILMEVQREVNKTKDPSATPPLPPTPLTPK